jgi:hypothetical protein
MAYIPDEAYIYIHMQVIDIALTRALQEEEKTGRKQPEL